VAWSVRLPAGGGGPAAQVHAARTGRWINQGVGENEYVEKDGWS
jgi:hypothetical protein